MKTIASLVAGVFLLSVAAFVGTAHANDKVEKTEKTEKTEKKTEKKDDKKAEKGW